MLTQAFLQEPLDFFFVCLCLSINNMCVCCCLREHPVFFFFFALPRTRPSEDCFCCGLLRYRSLQGPCYETEKLELKLKKDVDVLVLWFIPPQEQSTRTSRSICADRSPGLVSGCWAGTRPGSLWVRRRVRRLVWRWAWNPVIFSSLTHYTTHCVHLTLDLWPLSEWWLWLLPCLFGCLLK